MSLRVKLDTNNRIQIVSNDNGVWTADFDYENRTNHLIGYEGRCVISAFINVFQNYSIDVVLVMDDGFRLRVTQRVIGYPTEWELNEWLGQHINEMIDELFLQVNMFKENPDMLDRLFTT